MEEPPTAAVVAAASPAGGGGARVSILRQHQLLVVWDCVLLTAGPLLVYQSREGNRFPYSPAAVNLLTELVKCALSVCVLIAKKVYGSTGEPERPALAFWKAFLGSVNATADLAVPAFLFSVSNYLKFILHLYFDPTTVKLFANLKILMIACFLRVFLKRRYSVLQWQALTLLVLGVCVNQFVCLRPSSSNQENSAQVHWIAYFYMLVCVTIPAAASVRSEYAVKKHYETSIHVQNAFYCFYAVCSNSALFAITTSYERLKQPFSENQEGNVVASGYQSLLAGQSTITFCIILVNSLQGLLASFFYKFADTILKKYSSALATICMGLASAALLGQPITPSFCIGVSIVIISIHQFYEGQSSRLSGVPSSSQLTEDEADKKRLFVVKEDSL